MPKCQDFSLYLTKGYLNLYSFEFRFIYYSFSVKLILSLVTNLCDMAGFMVFQNLLIYETQLTFKRL